jgi:hypothetical protein
VLPTIEAIRRFMLNEEPMGGGEPGNGLQTPIAIVILGGLLSATALDRVVLPACTRSGVTGRQSSVNAAWLEGTSRLRPPASGSRSTVGSGTSRRIRSRERT